MLPDFIRALGHPLFWHHAKRILGTANLWKNGTYTRFMPLALIAVAMVVPAVIGYIVYPHHSAAGALTESKVAVTGVLLYVAYKMLMGTLEVVLNESAEFDQAVQWVTFPVRLGVPLAALGYFIGDRIAVANASAIVQASAIPALALFLLTAGLYRASYAAWRGSSGAEVDQQQEDINCQHDR